MVEEKKTIAPREVVREVLPNGIELLMAEDHFSRSIAIQCWVRVGALDEGDAERGMSHYIEHMLFKGTAKRAVGEIASTVEACGGDINAYTTFDRTVFYLTLASKHLETGIDLLSDAIFHSSFDKDEFEREREVILEEIKRSLDDPGSKVGRKIFELTYGNVGMGRPIIGDSDSVRSFKPEMLKDYHRRWYTPENMSVVIVGDFESHQARKIVMSTFGREAPKQTPKRQSHIYSESNSPKIVLLKGDYKQPRMEISFKVPSLESHETAPLDLAAFAVGSGDLSRFSRRLRDEQQVITGAGCSVYSPIQQDGILEASVFVAEENYLKAATAVCGELAKLREVDPVTEVELERARASLRADRIYRDETVEGQAKSLGYSLMTSHKQVFDEVYWSHIVSATPHRVREACRRWLNPKNAVIVGMVPEASSIDEAQLLKACMSGFDKAPMIAGTPMKFSGSGGRTRNNGDEAIVSEIKPGIKLVYKLNPQGKLFSLVAASEGGLRGESLAEAGLYCAMTALLANASRDYSYEEMLGIIESLGATLDGFSGKDSFGMQFHCLTEHVDVVLGLFSSALLHPVFPAEQWASVQREILEAIKAKDDSPAGVCIRNLQELMFGEHPYSRPIYGTRDVVTGYTVAGLQERFLELRDQGSWVISCVGSLDPAEVAAKLESELSGWNPRAKAREFPSDRQLSKGTPAKRRISKDREQSHLAIGFPGLNWADPDRAALDVLVNILGGHGGRLFRKLRDRDSLAYTVSPIVSYGKHPGAVGSYIACAPEKVEQAVASLKREMYGMKDAAPTVEETERSRNYIVGSHEMDLQRSDAQAMTMALMELYGLGHDDFRNYPKMIEKVTPADILRVARRLFAEPQICEVVVGSGGDLNLES